MPTAKPKNPRATPAVTLVTPAVFVEVEPTVAELLVVSAIVEEIVAESPEVPAVAEELVADASAPDVVVDTDETALEVDPLIPPVLAATLAADVAPLAAVYAPVFTFPLSPVSPT